MLSYRTREFPLGGEFAATRDTLSPAGGGPDATGRVISGFGVYHVPKSGVALIARVDRKSTRLNSSHGYISYAVFCLKKKKNIMSNVKIIISSILYIQPLCRESS